MSANEDKTRRPEKDILFISRLDRDSLYRTNALSNAISRAAQDGGIEGNLDVLSLAEVYYNWLQGDTNKTASPTLEEQHAETRPIEIRSKLNK